MSELAEIAEMAGITIIETPSGDSENCNVSSCVEDTKGDQNNDIDNGDSNTIKLSDDPNTALEDLSVDALDAEFACRYTDIDPDYVENLSKSEDISKPPVITDFFCRPPRRNNSRGGYNRNWDRGHGDHRRDHNRDHNMRGSGDHRRYDDGYRNNRQGSYHGQGSYRERDDRHNYRDDRRGGFNRDRY